MKDISPWTIFIVLILVAAAIMFVADFNAMRREAARIDNSKE
jgi:hypothetical protein